MNSMNFFSSIGSGTTAIQEDDAMHASDGDQGSWDKENRDPYDGNSVQSRRMDEDNHMTADEKTPLLDASAEHRRDTAPTDTATSIEYKKPAARTFFGSVAGAFQFIVTALLSPGRYLVACFYDENGQFSALLPLYRLGRVFSRQPKSRRRRPPRMAHDIAGLASAEGENQGEYDQQSKRFSIASSSSDSASDWDAKDELSDVDSPSKHTRSRKGPAEEDSETDGHRRSIRIKVLNEDDLHRRKQRHTPSTAASIKSPTSPTSSLGLTKYPRSPAPPRPLIPRRQPSYSSTNPLVLGSQSAGTQKTLIIDLDETLIHSMAKGGRMSTGHMVEVKLQHPVSAGGAVLGPSVPILYYVHKRPHCDEFLRKVSKWYNLVVFTASVQEYADPVIDWLELERKYFSRRYYRQHCTLRNGAYIKDLGHVEPDLSNAIILDNSPLSYAFHQDNAVPIEGWISDPTDNNLLHLIPLFEALQYTTDVRSLLALRQGELPVP